ncbi:MAG: DNA-3-methyladenine glycosylase family protein [Alphaproteobacteria bacterium]
MSHSLPRRLRSYAEIDQHIQSLVRCDPLLAEAHAIGGRPRKRLETGDFRAIARIIVHQQVSLKSAAAICDRLEEGLDGITPATVLIAGESGLGRLGLTRAKAKSIYQIARQVHEKSFSFQRLARMEDESARAALIALPGIGPWSAEIYLLTHMGRADAFPAGDLALQEVVRVLEGQKERPTEDALMARAVRWKPSRAVAARLLWAAYPIIKSKAY